MIYKIAPVYGKKNPMIYLSICSSVGSVSIMAIKGFGIAVKLTLGGNNQFTHPSTYVFGIVVVVCILTQMNYFNKALSQFSTNMYVAIGTFRHMILTMTSVNPLYYVTFTTCTLVASFILFRGFNTTDSINTISLLCGFLTIFTGVYLLNLSREDPDGANLGINQLDARGKYHEVDGIPTDGLAGLQTRMSMQARRSGEGHRRSTSWTLRTGGGRYGNDPTALHAYDVEAHNLHDLADDSDEDTSGGDSARKRTSFDDGSGRRVHGEPSAPRRTERVDGGGVKAFDRNSR